MSSMFARIAGIAAAGLVALSAACSAEEPGRAQSGPTIETTANAPASSGGDSPATGLGALKPCDLLTAGEVTGLGLTGPGAAERVGGDDGCVWKISGNGGLTVSVMPEKGPKDLNLTGDKVSPSRVGKYDATRTEAPLGGKYACSLLISVTGTSSVDVLANLTASSTDTAAACERATRAAELIAPKLP